MMSAICTRDQLLDLIRKSRILEGPALDAFLAGERTHEAGASRNAEVLADRLVQGGLLTRFQSKLLLQGKWRGFFLAEKYKILSLLGAGGAGRVYLCEHRQLKRLVAVKVLPGDRKDSEHLQRFYREARAVAALNHPNIVRVFDIDESDEVHYMVLEYVDGRALNDIVALKGPLAIERAAHYIAQSAAGLDHAHAAGWIHRDIKPGNILLERTGTIKVLDLGLARLYAEHDSLTSTGEPPALLGTADYISPEQALSAHTADARADIYGLGATFYYLVCGQPPFPKGSLANKLLWHQVQTPERVTRIRPDAPLEVERVIERMMAKDPQARFQTMAELLVALERWTSRPIDPPPADEMPPRYGTLSERAVSLSTSPTVIATGRSTTVVEDRADRKPHSAIARLQEAQAVLRDPARIPSGWIAGSAGVVLCMAILAIVRYAIRAESRSPLPTVAAKAPPQPAARPYVPCPNFASSSPIPAGRTPLRVVREGGQGTFPTIAAALARAEAGDVIRVEPPAALAGEASRAWEERLEIRQIPPGITLEGYDPTGNARPVEWIAGEGGAELPLVKIAEVERLKVRGFRLNGQDRLDALVAVSGQCPGLVLEDLWLEGFRATAVSLAGVAGESAIPLRLERLRVVAHLFSKAESAISLGKNNRHLRIADCRFEGPFEAVLRLTGPVERMEFTGNRAFKVDAIVAGALSDPPFKLDLALRSNTFCEISHASFRFEPSPPEGRISLEDNLFLMTASFCRVNDAPPAAASKVLSLFAPSSGNVLDQVSMREGVRPTGAETRAFQPLGIDPDSDVTFLRYPWNSSLRTAGTAGRPVGAAPVAEPAGKP